MADDGATERDGQVATPAPRLENLTLWERVHQHLREEILSDRLPAGTELSEVALARELGVSRGPIRESIVRLASEGLVLVRPRRGAIVRSLSRDEFVEAYQVREALEVMAVRLAVPRLDRGRLRRAAADQRRARADVAGGDVGGFFETNAAFHAVFVAASGNDTLGEIYRQLLGQMGRYRLQSLSLRGNLERSIAEHRAIVQAAAEGDAERAARLMAEHIQVPQMRVHSLDEAESARPGRPRGDALTRRPLEFGVNLNNREPLIAPDYDLDMLLDLSSEVEERGFDSVWLGDSLFSKPRYEPISLLSAISQRTSKVKLGTACMVSSTRNPLYLALEWATLDRISHGRTILGTGMGNPEEGVRREFEALGLDYTRRGAIFEEGLAAIRQLWTDGKVTLDGEFFQYDDVSFYSGTEMGPLMPVQSPPPIWVVSNPRLRGDAEPDVMERRIRAACNRIVKYGDGWMTCCRAQHPEELVDQLAWIRKVADEQGADMDRLVISYQVTMNIGDSEDEARGAFNDYISKYYPELSQAMDLSNWGPVGTPAQISEWIRTFAEAGVDHFICRFGAIDQFGQVERFADEVLPEFTRERVG